MASVIATTKVAGFTSTTSSLAPTGGTALGGMVTINILDNGGITFNDAGGNKRSMDYSPELHALLEQLTVGTNGVSSVKKWHR